MVQVPRQAKQLDKVIIVIKVKGDLASFFYYAMREPLKFPSSVTCPLGQTPT